MHPNFITNTGFIICGLSFLLGVLGKKDVALHIFVFGFYMAVLGFSLSSFRSEGISTGQKIAMGGFVLASLAFLPLKYFDSEAISTFIFYSGGAVVLLGIIGHSRNMK